MSCVYTTLALDNSENDKSTGASWHKNIFIASRNSSSFSPSIYAYASLFLFLFEREREREIDFNLFKLQKAAYKRSLIKNDITLITTLII